MNAPLEFRIHGMDCADEVAILRRELAPLVGEAALVEAPGQRLPPREQPFPRLALTVARVDGGEDKAGMVVHAPHSREARRR